MVSQVCGTLYLEYTSSRLGADSIAGNCQLTQTGDVRIAGSVLICSQFWLMPIRSANSSCIISKPRIWRMRRPTSAPLRRGLAGRWV